MQSGAALCGARSPASLYRVADDSQEDVRAPEASSQRDQMKTGRLALCQPPGAQDATSLGLRLVGMFVEQLGGTMVLSSDEGTHCAVAFPAGDTS
jgi:hypothetical protein